MVKGQRLNVTDVPTRLSTADSDGGAGSSIYLKNRDAAHSVDVGGSDVVTAEGYELLAGEGVSLDLHGGEAAYAVAAAGIVVRVDIIEGGI